MIVGVIFCLNKSDWVIFLRGWLDASGVSDNDIGDGDDDDNDVNDAIDDVDRKWIDSFWS